MPTPLPVIPGVYRCAWLWEETDTGQTAVNVIHVGRTDFTADESAIFAALELAVNDGGGGRFDCSVNTARVQRVAITKLDGTSATQTFTTTASGWQGNQIDVDFPPAVSCLVKVTTGDRGRDNRGRIFIPFVSEASNVKGQLGASQLTTMQPLWTDWISFLPSTAPAISIGVASYDRAHAGAGAHFTPATQLGVEPVLATQRKRQGRLRGS